MGPHHTGTSIVAKALGGLRFNLGERSELLIQREPMLDDAHFQMFLDTLTPIMKPGHDVCWILGGRLADNEKAIIKELNERNLIFKKLFLVYDAKLLEKYYWRM